MAARSVRCLFSNQTPSSITLDSDHHEYGRFLDAWRPPAVIGPGSVGEWRSVSDGFLQGTEGSARYRLSVPDSTGGHFEFVDANWNNPFVGTNSASMTAEVAFTKAPTTTLRMSWAIHHGSAPPNIEKLLEGDAEAIIDAILTGLVGIGPLYLLANWDTSSHDDAVAIYAVRENAQPQFVPAFPFELKPTPKNVVRNASGNSTEWAGRWWSADVSLTLENLGGQKMLAYVTDRSTSPIIQFQQEFSLGWPTWVAQDALTQVLDTEVGRGSAQVGGIYDSAARHTIAVAGTRIEKPLAETFSDYTLASARDRGLALSKPAAYAVGETISSFVKENKSSVALMNGIYLALYDVMQGKQKTGSFISYSRHEAGRVVYASDLQYVLQVS